MSTQETMVSTIKTTPTAALFYALAGLMVTADLALMSGAVWVALRETGSAMLVGVILFVATLVPLCIKQASAALSKTGVSLSVGSLSAYRYVAAVSFLVLALVGNTNATILYLAIAFGIGIVNFVTQSGIEMLNARLGEGEFVDRAKSVKFVQLSVQLGAFAGAASGGFLVEMLPFTSFLGVLVGVSLVVTIALQLTLSGQLSAQPNASGAVTSPSVATANVPEVLPEGRFLLIGIMAMVGAHIGAFNGFLPFLYQTIHGWSGYEFGLASAMAALGALCAIALPVKRSVLLGLAGLLLLSDALLSFVAIRWLSIGSVFVIGVSVSYVRLMMRHEVITADWTPGVKESLIGKMVMTFMVAMGCLPLLMGIVISNTPPELNAAALLFVGLAATLLGLTVSKLIAGEKRAQSEAEVNYES
ncbi:hypothetical protein [Reinekea blandensis]|uniref:MFS transporter n=1 Tax=Reinekea blandensis MED297 TaxID=314283 RepID=A4BF15_9GAMM|nr:hypothetical protein [Reinekea blandensis]EAR09350.1 hypothetical protein MED297_18718 [Reinekea sp. MED297] [Reinekea blandensis MED297]